MESTANRYQTLIPVAAGATAEVYRAYDTARGCDVAIKLLQIRHDDLVARLAREARTLARLSHPALCRVFDVGELHGRPYLAMEWVDGRELDQAVDDLPLRTRVRLVADVAEALAVVHRAGLVHRDVKPANILVQRSDDDGAPRAILVDFGLVLAPQETLLTATGLVLGTPAYMAPEQSLGRRDKVAPMTDVYGLGATLFHVITGRPPFIADHSVELMIQGVKTAPPLLRDLVPDVPPALEAITQRCLNKRPVDRYPDADALAVDLRAWLDDAPVIARPLSPWGRLAYRARPHRAPLMASFVIVVLGALLLTLLGWRSARERVQMQEITRAAEGWEGAVRAATLSAPHDLRPTYDRVRRGMDALAARFDGLSSTAQASADAALGRGYLMLDRRPIGGPARGAPSDLDEARRHLDRAWAGGVRTARVAYARGLTLTRLYERAVDETLRIPDGASRRTRLRALDASLRRPAIDALARARPRTATDVRHAPAAYRQALLAYNQDRDVEALRLLAEAARTANRPDGGERALLINAIHKRQAARASLRGDHRAAYDALTRADAALAQAQRSAGSAPNVVLQRCYVGRERLGLSALDGAQTTDALLALKQQTVAACRIGQQLGLEPALFLAQEALVHLNVAEALDARQVPDGGALHAAWRAGLDALRHAPGAEFGHWALAEIHSASLRRARAGASGVDPQPFAALGIAHHRAALAHRPDDPRLLWTLGRLYKTRAEAAWNAAADPDLDQRRALHHLLRAQRRLPEAADLMREIGEVYFHRALRAHGAGLPFLEPTLTADRWTRRALSIAPDDPFLLAALGTIQTARAAHAFHHGGAPDPLMRQALAYYERAMVQNPDVGYYDRVTALYYRARYRFLRGTAADEAIAAAASAADEIAFLADTPYATFYRRRALDARTLAAHHALASGSDPSAHTAPMRAHLAALDPALWPVLAYGSGIQALNVLALSELAEGDRRAALTTLDRAAAWIEQGRAAGVSPIEMDAFTGTVFFLRAVATADRAAFERAYTLWDDALQRNPWLTIDIDPWRGPRVRGERDLRGVALPEPLERAPGEP